MTATVLDDAELIAESLRDPEVFAQLFDRYSGMIYRYISRRLVSGSQGAGSGPGSAGRS